MSTRHEVVLNLGTLLQHAPGSSTEVVAEGDYFPSEELLEQYGLQVDGLLSYHIDVSNAGGDDDFIVQGSIRGTIISECRRCLDPVRTDLDVDFVFAMEYHPSEQPLYLHEPEDYDEDEYLIFGSPVVDFSDVLTQLFAFEEPLTVLCSEGCLGLNEDGINLNHHPELAQQVEEVEEDEESSPFAQLKDILD